MTAMEMATQVEALQRYRRYPAYKNSGVDWLGSIPEHWKESKVKHLGSYINGYPFKPEDWSSDGLPIIRIQNLTNPEAPFNHFAGEVNARCRVRNGDILISWSASLGIYIWKRDDDGWLNQHIFKVSLREDIVDRQFFIWLGDWFIRELQKEAHGSTMTHLTNNMFGGFRVELPPVDEQRAIASFLNRETARIDDLVAKKQRLIELLQEQRSAIITSAATKGLDQSVPMKDSGVEWLGEIPEHWEVEKGKHLFRALSDAPIEGDGVVTAYRDGEVTLRENRRTEGYTFAIQEVGYQRVRYGNLVINGMDAFAGAIGVSDSTGKCTPEYLVLEPVNRTMNSCFFANALRLMAKRGFILVVCNAVRERAPRFRLPQFQDILLPVPPVDEQHAIAQFILLECERIDPLINKVCEAITRLQELRSALISAAVSGKIDVREEVG